MSDVHFSHKHHPTSDFLKLYSVHPDLRFTSSNDAGHGLVLVCADFHPVHACTGGDIVGEVCKRYKPSDLLPDLSYLLILWLGNRTSENF